MSAKTTLVYIEIKITEGSIASDKPAKCVGPYATKGEAVRHLSDRGWVTYGFDDRWYAKDDTHLMAFVTSIELEQRNQLPYNQLDVIS